MDQKSMIFGNMTNAIKKECFFCGEPIIGKSHLEHVIPDKLLELLNLKNKECTLLHQGKVTYSRLKVDAHQKCNNEFGSRYEDKILNVLKNISSHKDDLEFMHQSQDLIIGYSEELSHIFSTWFTKIIYGMIWFEAKLKKDIDPKIREFLSGFLFDRNFEMMRQSYKAGMGFNLPSSIYYLKLKCIGAIPFDFGFKYEPMIFWLKIDDHLFMACIGDGQITSNYLNDYNLKKIMKSEIPSDRSIFYLTALSRMVTTRIVMPKRPSFVISENQIFNMSLSTMALPEALQLDMDLYSQVLDETYNSFLSHLKIPKEKVKFS